MTIKFKIVEANPEQHSIVVRFYSDDLTEEMLCVQRDENTGAILRCRTDFNIDLPVPAPEGDALVEFISARAPVRWFEIQKAVADPNVDTSLSHAIGLMGLEQTHKAPEQKPAVFSIPVDTVRA